MQATATRLQAAEQAKQTFRASAQGRQERLASRLAYHDVGRASAASLLGTAFPQVAGAPSIDPLGDASHGRRVVFSDDDTALIGADPADRQLVESTGTPLWVSDAAGGHVPLDLSLSATASGFRPAAPLVSVGLPATASDGITIGDDGVRMTVASTGGDTDVQGVLSGRRVFYADGAGADTDLLAEPTTKGAGVLLQIRSADSPEQYTLHFKLPDGASLAADAQTGAINVTEAGQAVGTLEAPYASDAQGADVPVTYTISGADDVIVGVAHQSADVAYPILVDPVYDDWASAGITAAAAVGDWMSYGSGGPFTFGTSGSYGSGLYVTETAKVQTSGEQWGGWYYRTTTNHGPSTYIPEADFYNMVGSYHGGVHTAANIWVGLSSPGGPFATEIEEPGNSYPTTINQAATGGTPGTTDTEFFLDQPTSAKPNQPDDAALGGAYVTLDDDSTATITDTPPSGLSSHTYGPDATINTDIAAGSTGLGVQTYDVYGPNSYHQSFPDITSGHTAACVGNDADPCPLIWGPTFTASTNDMNDGANVYTARSYEPIGHTSSPASWTVHVDKTPPTGSLTDVPTAVRGAITIGGTEADTEAGTGGWSLSYQPVGATTWNEACVAAQPAGSSSFSCHVGSTGVPDGNYLLRAHMTDDIQPGYGTPNSADTETAPMTVDNTAPTGSLDPVASVIAGTRTITGTMTDAGTGPGAWTLQYKLHTDSDWDTACIAHAATSGSTWGCDWDTTGVTDGTYDLRARMADQVPDDGGGPNTIYTDTTSTTIDNTPPTGSLDDVDAAISGSTSIAGTMTDTGAGPGTWTLEDRPHGAATWSTACSTTTPTSGDTFSCVWDTTTVSEGSYDLRAKMTDAVSSDDGGPNTYYTSEDTTVTTIVDNAAPEINLSGALSDDDGQTLPNGDYALHVAATDGITSAPSTKQAGVTHIDIAVDGTQADAVDTPCATDSCGLTDDWTFDTTQYPGGTHEIVVTAIDGVGNISTQTLHVTTTCCAQPPSTWGTVGTGDNVAYGDFDGDGNADLLDMSPSGSDNDLGVRLSDGTTSFAAAGGAPWGTVPLGDPVAVGDVDGDGLTDVVHLEPPTLADPTHQVIRVQLSTGSAFSSAVTWGSWPAGYDIHVADVDGDGLADLIGSDPTTGDVEVAYSQGDSFDTPSSWATLGTHEDPYYADADGDGMTDLITHDTSTGALDVSLSDGGSFTTAQSWGTLSSGRILGFADANADIAADLFYESSSNDDILLRTSDDTQFTAARTWTGASGVTTSDQVAFPDVNADNDADLMVRSTSGTLTGFLGNMVDGGQQLPPFTPDPTLDYDGSGATTATATPAMALGFTDNSQFVGNTLHFTGAGGDFSRFDRSARRVSQAGGSIIRIIVDWGAFENDLDATPYDYIAGIDNAVTRAHSMGLDVYMTLTGDANGDVRTGGGLTGVDPTPSGFAAFVHDAVSRYKAMGVHMYAMWNEPNKPYFLQASCPAPSGKKLTTAALYRSLYLAGYAQAKADDPSASVYFGEFSEQADSNYAQCSDTHKSPLNLHDYLDEIADSSSTPIKTAGVAWHAYQPLGLPTKRETDVLGIGGLPKLQEYVENRYKDGELETPEGKVPRIDITEFGYFNRPYRQDGSNPKKWFSEAARATRYYNALTWALSGAHAGGGTGAKPGMFLLYETAEEPPTDTVNLDDPSNFQRKISFDTGMIDPNNGAVTGNRGYGKGSTNRSAYCRIRTWAVNNHYSPPQASLPTDVDKCG